MAGSQDIELARISQRVSRLGATTMESDGARQDLGSDRASPQAICSFTLGEGVGMA
jgi:hypothetical protein